jgi:hypothetical protein
MYKRYGDISNHTTPGSPPLSSMDLEEREDSDHEILVTIALLDPDARYIVLFLYSFSFPSTHACLSSDMMCGGQVTLNHSSPHSTPQISLPKGAKRYLSDRDKLVLAWGVQQVRQIFQTPPLRDLTLGEVTPGSGVLGKSLVQWIDKSSLTNSHWVGTAAMGPSSPPLRPPLWDKGDDEEAEGEDSRSSPTSAPYSFSSRSSRRQLNKGKGQAHSSSQSPTFDSGDAAQSVLDAQFRVRGVSNLRVAGLIPLSSVCNSSSSHLSLCSRPLPQTPLPSL